MRYSAIVKQEKNGAFIAKVPDLPECISEGRTQREALENLNNVVECYLQGFKKKDDSPLGTF